MASQRGAQTRKAHTDEKVFDAVIEMLCRCGLQAVNVEAVSHLSGVAKTTIYRRYADRTELIEAAVAHHVVPVSVIEDGDPRRGLIAGVGAMTVASEEYVGISLLAVLTASDDPAAAMIRERVVQPRIDCLSSILSGWVAAGEVRSDLNIELTVATIVGTVVMTYARYRTFEPGWVDSFVEHLWPLLRP